MRKRLIALILLVTVPLLFGIAWFMSERSFTLSLEREKKRIQATQGVVFRDVQQTMQSLTYLEAVAYARQYTQYYHAQGIDLIFCWRGNPIADALLPNRYYDGLICGQRAAMLDTGSRPQRYAVAEPVNSNLTVILLGDVGDIYALKDSFRQMAFAVAGGGSALLILLALVLAGWQWNRGIALRRHGPGGFREFPERAGQDIGQNQRKQNQQGRCSTRHGKGHPAEGIFQGVNVPDIPQENHGQIAVHRLCHRITLRPAAGLFLF